MSLLDSFNDYETKYGSGEIYKFKRIFDRVDSSKNYEQMKFDMKIMFAFVDALEPKNLLVDVDERVKEVSELEFQPTLSVPNMNFRDKLSREFSMWYKPVFYYPHTDSAKALIPDFVAIKGGYGPLYNMDEEIKKTLWTEKYFTGRALNNLSSMLLNRLKPIHTLVFSRKRYSASDMTMLKAASFFLKPYKMLVVSQEEIPAQLKMNLPIATYAVEKVDMNIEKFKETVRRIV